MESGLDPKRCRVDYGQQLQPPEGYTLDSAIATTYTLDLDTLLTVPVALCFSDTLEGELQGEKLALLEAVGQLKGKLKVFYQAGKIKIPQAYNRLFVLLESWLQPVMPEGGENSSFHPKMWLLRFISPDQPVRYRLLVLSRNLTFDRSWDLAASLDGELQEGTVATNDAGGWLNFVRILLDQTDDFSPATQFLEELPYILWEAPQKFRDPRLAAGGPSLGSPVELQKANDGLLVCSPFLKDSLGDIKALNVLTGHAPDSKRWLFSRAEELDAIGAEKLKDWECFSINANVVDGEERLQVGTSRHNLHAKLIVVQRGDTTHWHLGSANATSAAMGNLNNDFPRNTELMLRLSGRTRELGPKALMEQWLGDEHKVGNGLFVTHEFTTLEIQDSETGGINLRSIAFRLLKAKWRLQAALQDNGLYGLQLTIGDLHSIPEGVDVSVGQLGIADSYKSIDATLQWVNVNLSQISALLPVRITNLQTNETEYLVLKTDLVLPEGSDRERRILEQLIDGKDKFLNYIRLLLQRQPDKNEWLGFDKASSQSDSIYTLFGDSPLFEQLMDAAARHPDALLRIKKLLGRLAETEVPIPDNFRQLWTHFEPEITKWAGKSQ
jgi:hypothetical protein